ncbi:conserved hypothetical protein [Ricinus communis]|uniref:Uncharacterized protein n=1 Tax=Ricinus communis TaxID=3988 RepID=B9RM52_RICCO|nr:conserved hypothetical protein [Ricinus communis]
MWLQLLSGSFGPAGIMWSEGLIVGCFYLVHSKMEAGSNYCRYGRQLQAYSAGCEMGTPPKNWIKCNVDGALFQDISEAGAGCVLRERRFLYCSKISCYACPKRIINEISCLRSLLSEGVEDVSIIGKTTIA